MDRQDSDDEGKSYAKYVATVAGGAIGWAAGQTIGASVAVPVTSLLVIGGLGPAVLAFGGAAVGALGAYKLVSKALKK